MSQTQSSPPSAAASRPTISSRVSSARARKRGAKALGMADRSFLGGQHGLSPLGILAGLTMKRGCPRNRYLSISIGANTEEDAERSSENMQSTWPGPGP